MNLIRKALAYGIFMVFMSSTQAWSHSSSLQSYTLDGRTFFPFNLLTGNNRFNKNARITAIESNIRRLTSANSIQSTKISTLESVQATHTGQISALTALQTAQGTQISSFQQSLTTANARITALEASDVTSNARIAALEAADTASDAKITALAAAQAVSDGKIATLETAVKTECPATATNGEVVGSKCYTVNAGPVDLAGARTACTSQGGILAEPPVGSNAALEAFVTSLVAVFGANFGLTTNPIIGVTETTVVDAFQYDSSGLLVSSVVITGLTGTGTADDLAVIDLTAPNTLAVVTLLTASNPFICQFELV